MPNWGGCKLRDNNKLLTISLGALLILILCGTVYQGLSINSLKNTIKNMHNQIATLDNQLGSRINDMNQSLNTFKEEQKWAHNADYKILEYNNKTGEVKLRVTWSLREVPPSTKIILSYSEKNSNPEGGANWNKVKADNDTALNYSGEIYLSPKKNYIFKVQSEGTVSARSDDLMQLPLKDIIENRLSLVPHMGSKKGPRYDHHGYLVNRFKGSEFLKLKSAKADVYLDNQLVNTVELFKAPLEEIEDDTIKKYDLNSDSELWLNEDAIWIKGEENWVKTGENSWSNKSNVPGAGASNVRIEITAVDNMGSTYKRVYPPKN